MSSVMRLLEERELNARQRVDVLREEAEQVLAALRDAEVAWERFVITRETMSEVLSAPSGDGLHPVADCDDGRPGGCACPGAQGSRGSGGFGDSGVAGRTCRIGSPSRLSAAPQCHGRQ